MGHCCFTVQSLILVKLVQLRASLAVPALVIIVAVILWAYYQIYQTVWSLRHPTWSASFGCFEVQDQFLRSCQLRLYLIVVIVRLPNSYHQIGRLMLLVAVVVVPHPYLILQTYHSSPPIATMVRPVGPWMGTKFTIVAMALTSGWVTAANCCSWKWMRFIAVEAVGYC